MSDDIVIGLRTGTVRSGRVCRDGESWLAVGSNGVGRS
jgi:hypothetical protein